MKLVLELHTAFYAYANTQQAIEQAAYMKNKFSFLGIQKPGRARLEKEVFKRILLSSQQELIDAITLLWHKDEREFQYAACELAFFYKKLWTSAIFPLFEHMIRTKSWWDTVDDIAVNCVGPLLFKHPELIEHMDNWITDENMWIRRSALLFQLRWKEKTHKEQLFNYCIKTMHEKEFFIRKAVGWVLREYSKTDPISVRNFIQENRSHLSGLSLREASKYI